MEFTVSSIESSIETRYSIVNTREYRVSSVTLHLGGTVVLSFNSEDIKSYTNKKE